ncbi:MAG TPA: hypothetical protein VN704_00575 [Verrucomicrobiae bacterium]|nr:hypothetical protein [Verrucomicrobiae bacterium]
MSNSVNIYINSASGYRDITGTNENFTITKPVSNFNKIPKRVKLLSARIPFVWNNVTANNNAYALLEYPGPIGYTGTVAVGRYTGAALATALQTSLNAILAISNTYTVTYDATNLKFNITSTPSTFQFNFNVANSIGPLLGFAETTTTNTANLISPITLLQPDNEVLIQSSLVGGIDNGIVPWFTGATEDLQILAVIPINPNTNNMIIYQSPDSEPWKNLSQSAFAMIPNNGDTLLKMSFNLLLLSGIPISLSNNPWSANLLMEF